jgi:fatty-acyl-CoA synthase
MPIRAGRAVWDADGTGIELLDITIGGLLDLQAAAFPSREALVYQYPEIGLDLRLTYGRYRVEADRLAKGLLAIGTAIGDHVAVWATNVPEWPVLEMALAKVGAVFVAVNTKYRSSELEYLLRQGDVTTLVLTSGYRDNSFLEAVDAIAPELKELKDPAVEELRCSRLPRLRRAIFIGDPAPRGQLSYGHVVSRGDGVPDEKLRERQARVCADDVAMIQYTSGTTGFPKGVMLSHGGLINNALLFSRRWNWKRDDRLVTPMPFFHAAGCGLFILGGLASGAAVIPLITFDPGKQLELIEKERATCTFGVPTMLIAILNHPRLRAPDLDLSSLRLVGSGGAPVPVSLMAQIRERLGVDIAIAFGQTESSGVITTTPAGDPFELKSATVGIPLPHVEVKIVDTAGGEALGFGQQGELLIRGYQVMKGYYKMPEKTAEAIDSDGWLHTGDLATMNQNGYVNIVGRLKDMVIRGGENLYPVEIEAYLMSHPKIAEAQVVGVPDSFMGEELCAAIRLKASESADEDEIREYCRFGMSRHKVPRYFRFLSEFPTTASGKVRKFELKQQMIKELGLDDAVTSRTM